MTEWTQNDTQMAAPEPEPAHQEEHGPEPTTSSRPRRHPANVAMAIASVVLALVVVGAVFTTIGARSARSDYQSDTDARIRTTTVLRTRTDAALGRAEEVQVRTQAVVDAYSALDDALTANTTAQRAYADSVNAAIDRYNAGDD